MRLNSPDKKYRILVAASSVKRSGLIASINSDQHYQLIQPKTPAEALKAAGAGPLDLILVDDDNTISIPDLVIRAKSVDAETPILVFKDHVPSLADDRLWTLGIDDCMIQPVTPAKFLHHIARALKMRRLGMKCDELTKENSQLYQLAITDGLTKLVNRRHFFERLATEFARAKRFGGRIGGAICDIDHFKSVNDTYGHAAGDRVLMGVAKIIAQTVRGIDIAGRYGGEEFGLLLPETALEGTLNLGEKIRHAIDEHDFTEDAGDLEGPAHITISIGCASFPEFTVNNSEELLELADQGLYRAKQTGRNRVVAIEAK